MGAFRAESSLEDIMKITMTRPSQVGIALSALWRSQTGNQHSCLPSLRSHTIEPIAFIKKDQQ
jgi:hypothetical protein